MLWVPTPIRKAAFGTRYGQTGARQTPGDPLFTWKSKLSRETRLAMGSMGPASAGCRAPHLNFSIPSARLHEQSTAAPPGPFPQRRAPSLSAGPACPAPSRPGRALQAPFPFSRRPGLNGAQGRGLSAAADANGGAAASREALRDQA